jgi:hypothetical protein
MRFATASPANDRRISSPNDVSRLAFSMRFNIVVGEVVRNAGRDGQDAHDGADEWDS